jgi:transcriptional regulator with XRE-family HTH domain
MKTKQALKMSDQLRRAVLDAPTSRRQIALRLSIDEGQLSRFVNGKGGLSMENSDRLCEFLGLELRPAGMPRAKKGG